MKICSKNTVQFAQVALFGLVAITAMVSVPLSAREVDRQEVHERFDPDVSQEQRLYCSDTQLFTLDDGSEYRACVNWRAQNRTRIVRTYAALEGPELDSDANLDTARACFDIAVATQNDPYRIDFNEDAFVTGARAVFNRCALARELLRRDEYALDIYDRGVWLGGSR